MVMVLVSDGDRMVILLVGDGDWMVMVLVGCTFCASTIFQASTQKHPFACANGPFCAGIESRLGTQIGAFGMQRSRAWCGTPPILGIVNMVGTRNFTCYMGAL